MYGKFVSVSMDSYTYDSPLRLILYPNLLYLELSVSMCNLLVREALQMQLPVLCVPRCSDHRSRGLGLKSRLAKIVLAMIRGLRMDEQEQDQSEKKSSKQLS